MTLRDALHDVLGHDLAESLLADMGTDWTLTAAFAAINARGLDTQAARELIAWDERRREDAPANRQEGRSDA